jgi:hypothetical protein
VTKVQRKYRGPRWSDNYLKIKKFTKRGEVFVYKVVLKTNLSLVFEIHSPVLVICSTKE